MFRWNVVVPANGGAVGGGYHEGSGTHVDDVGAIEVGAFVELTDIRSEEVGGTGEGGDKVESPLCEGEWG